jgi:hypothetical protein
MLRFTIRDVLWFTVVVAMGAGWWIDQDRIRRQEEALRVEAQSLHALPLRRAELVLAVAEAELAQSVEIRRRNPGAVSESEWRRQELQVDVAKLDIEKARATEKFGPATDNRP